MAEGSITLDQMFAHFSKFGDSKSNGTQITLTQCDKWMKQANIFGKTLTTTDTGICFKKFKSKTMDYGTFVKYIEDLAQSKNIEIEKFKGQLMGCGLPGTDGTTKAVKTGGVDRLTDTTQYTGTHKERFDKGGKGKGKAGREDTADDSGYVTGYKGKDTYDKKH